jgi:hypothetical protein
MKTIEKIIIVVIITGLIAWALGFLRFDYEWAAVLFKIVLFPFGFFYAIYESYCIGHFSPSSFWNDEIFQFVIFSVVVMSQSVLYYALFSFLRHKKAKSGMITQ